MPADNLYIGLMSGTSMDGIDAALVAFEKDTPKLLGHHFQPYPPQLRDQLLSLCQPGKDEIDQLGQLDIQVAEAFANATMTLLRNSVKQPGDIIAIGSHGQTLRHRPNLPYPFTLQIGDPNTLAHKTGITTIADFRRRDIAAGGQGAPLAPSFHQAIFRDLSMNRIILNIGGIANITWLPADPDVAVCGFDTGPGNTLLDHWISLNKSLHYDAEGRWAASGKVIPALLSQCLSDPYFNQPPPKSTGTDYFNLDWLYAQIKGNKYDPTDIQATLAELTATSISQSIVQRYASTAQLLVCGGGIHNQDLRQRLSNQLPGIEIDTTEKMGVDPDWVEAIAFAWLAKIHLQDLPGNLPSVTGANEPVILGGIFPGSSAKNTTLNAE